MPGMFGPAPRRSFFDDLLPSGNGIGQEGPALQMPEPRKLGLLDKIGLAGDIWTGDPVTRQRLMQDQAMQQRSMAAYEPQQIGDSIVRLNPQTGRYEAVYTAPAKPQAVQPTEFERLVAASGLPEDQRTLVIQDYVRNRAKNGGASLIGAPSGVTFTPLPPTSGGAGLSTPRPFP